MSLFPLADIISHVCSNLYHADIRALASIDHETSRQLCALIVAIYREIRMPECIFSITERAVAGVIMYTKVDLLTAFDTVHVMDELRYAGDKFTGLVRITGLSLTNRWKEYFICVKNNIATRCAVLDVLNGKVDCVTAFRHDPLHYAEYVSRLLRRTIYGCSRGGFVDSDNIRHLLALEMLVRQKTLRVTDYSQMLRILKSADD